MHICFLSSLVPDGHPTSGYEIANQAIVEGLRALGHKVSVVGLSLPRHRKSSDPDTHVLATMNVENSEASREQKIKWLLTSLYTGLPMSAAKLTSVPSSALEGVLQNAGPFDGYIFNSYQMAAAFPQLLDKPYLFVAHNVEYRSARENAASAASLGQRILYRRDARLLQEFEERLCAGALHVWTLSADDIATFGLTEKRASTLPLVTPQIPASNQISEKKFDIGLIGTWSWQPNLVGLKWFLNEVVPKLPENVSIAVAGGAPVGLVEQFPGAQFLGRVPDANEFLDSVRVVPLVSRGGTGVQLKTIEAFQAGHACVATQSSLRGVDTLPTNCIAADDAEDFAAGLEHLLAMSRAGKLPIAAGDAFYRKQNKALLDGLSHGLSRFS